MAQILCGLYQITNTVTGAFYVGSAGSIRRRWTQHRHDLRHQKHSNQRLQRAWNKYGEAAFEWRILAMLEPNELHASEQRLLDRVVPLSACYNMALTPTGGMTGRTHRPDSLEKMGRSHRGSRHTHATRAKMSAAHRGRVQTDEQTRKMKATLAARPESLARVERSQFQKGHGYRTHAAPTTDASQEDLWRP